MSKPTQVAALIVFGAGLSYAAFALAGQYQDRQVHHVLCLTPLVIVAFLPVRSQDVDLQKRSRRRGNIIALGMIAVAIAIILVAVASHR